jgi:hypothetical protein
VVLDDQDALGRQAKLRDVLDGCFEVAQAPNRALSR